jgi:hypothetical protein
MAARTCTRRAARWPVTGAVLTVLVLCWAAPAAADPQQPPKSLGEIAREEAARRKALKAPAKVYTKDDLPGSALLPLTPAGGGAAASADAPQDPAAAKPDTEKADAGKPDEGKDETWWRTRMTQAREAVRRNEMFVTALQSRLNALTADFAARDDPFQRAQITEERNKTLAELEQVSAEIKALQQEIAQIETEAREAGVPPGWIR